MKLGRAACLFLMRTTTRPVFPASIITMTIPVAVVVTCSATRRRRFQVLIHSLPPRQETSSSAQARRASHRTIQILPNARRDSATPERRDALSKYVVTPCPGAVASRRFPMVLTHEDFDAEIYSCCTAERSLWHCHRRRATDRDSKFASGPGSSRGARHGFWLIERSRGGRAGGGPLVQSHP